MPTQQTVIPFAPASTPANADQLDRAGQTILQLLNKAAGVAEVRSLRRRLRLIRSKPSARNNGCIEFIRRLRSASCVKTKTRVEALRKDDKL